MTGDQRVSPISEEWLTPPEIIRALGPIDTDPCVPCSMRHGFDAPWTIGDRRYCKCDNGLEREWKGFVWLNPPYGLNIGRWLAKMSKHRNGIALIFARTETGFFQDSVFRTASALFFPARRIRFHKPDGTPGGYTGGAPSVFVAYGTDAVYRLDELLKMRGCLVSLDGRRLK